MQKKILIEKMIRRRQLCKVDIMYYLNITRPTLLKLLSDVNLLNGYQRYKLAELLCVDVSIIDCLINSNDKELIELTEVFLNLIKPIADVSSKN